MSGQELPAPLLKQLIELCRQVSSGDYQRVEEIFEFTKEGSYPPLVSELAEAFGMMVVQVEGREFRLQGMVEELKKTNQELRRTLARVELLETIEGHLSKFVPEAVRRRIQRAPQAPDLAKHEQDVSVLFLDIAGYTRMSETVSGSEMNFLVEHYFSSFVDEIYQRQGDINETAGDGLMIIFQDESPALHAAQAVETALAIEERVARVNQELAERFQPVQVNVGINSGPALVGSSRFEGLAGTRWTFTASGPVTNLAARIGGQATEGRILIGPATAQRVGDRFSLKPLGPRPLKNVATAVELFQVLGPLPSSS